jgi:hypothetical protein
MKSLFVNFSGTKTVLMSASKQNQYSYSHKQKGSYFGISLRNAFFELTDNAHSKPSWENINEKAKYYTSRATDNTQEPQLKVIVSSSTFD